MYLQAAGQHADQATADVTSAVEDLTVGSVSTGETGKQKKLSKAQKRRVSISLYMYLEWMRVRGFFFRSWPKCHNPKLFKFHRKGEKIIGNHQYWGRLWFLTELKLKKV